jgi:hypothetical protein
VLLDSSGCEPCDDVLPSQVVATSQGGASMYRHGVAGTESGCPACTPHRPSGYAAICNATGHCEARFVACPPDVPADGSSCDEVGRACEYGTDLQLKCRTHASCAAGRWVVAAANCPALPGAGEQGCPADVSVGGACSPDRLPCGACSNDGLLCDIGGGATCVCDAYVVNDPLRWRCAVVAGDTRCSPYAPPLGSACSVQDQTCFYGLCYTATGVGRVCTRGAWEEGPVACPVP